jgi:alkylation response protein AidB-like acyl-CoA dehydrogenase
MNYDQINEYRITVQKHLSKSIKEIANDCEKNNSIASKTIKSIYKSVYLTLMQPYLCEKKQLDQTMIAVLQEEIGRISPAISGFFTVQSMVIAAIEQFGNEEQRKLLPSLYIGEILATFSLSEINAGSNIKNIKTNLVPCAEGYEVTGDKKWITMAQAADLHLVFGVYDRKITAFLLESNTPGLEVEPISDIIGFRGGMYGELHLRNCKVPSSNIIGGVGWGFPHVA